MQQQKAMVKLINTKDEVSFWLKSCLKNFLRLFIIILVLGLQGGRVTGVFHVVIL
jgi:hypothetical protein